MTNSSFHRLSPKEFNPALLKELVEQGRVFINCPQVDNKDAYKREALAYVRAIDDFATDLWREDIGRLWREIVEAECFEPCLALKKGLQAGHLNRYAITNLVSRMQGWGVYRRDVKMIDLHLALEHTTKRNNYYCSNGSYCLSPDANALLKQLLRRV